MVEVRWVPLEAGSFWAGSDDFYPDEAPGRQSAVAAFSISTTPITNNQFAAFVETTGYVTVAERPLSEVEFPDLAPRERLPGSLVFTPTAGPVDLRVWQNWWSWVPGACWHRPGGPGTTIDAKGDHPVVQVAYADAVACAEWMGARLPTEAEFEYAACGGVVPSPYVWGDQRDPDGKVMANTWHGLFPYRNDGARGWVGTSPVATFPPNRYGLFDCIGNVWEWTSDHYALPREGACACGPADPTPVTQRVLKGGSHLCAPEYCLRYRPAARSPQAEDSATTHVGFRVAKDG